MARFCATHALETRVRGKQHGWNPLACLASGEQIIKAIRDQILSDADAVDKERALASGDEAPTADWPVFRVSFDPATGSIAVRKLTPSEVEQQVNAAKKKEERVGFLLKRWVDIARHLSSSDPLAAPHSFITDSRATQEKAHKLQSRQIPITRRRLRPKKFHELDLGRRSARGPCRGFFAALLDLTEGQTRMQQLLGRCPLVSGSTRAWRLEEGQIAPI